MRTVATFDSAAFNLTEHRAHYVNEGCFGDDVGRWLIERLPSAGAVAEPEPGQEDFGWYVNYSVGDQPFCAVIGNVGGEFWFVAVERVTGFLGSMLGQRTRSVPIAGIDCIHHVLSTSPDVRNLKWHYWSAFKRGGAEAFDAGADLPSAP
jgi:hypothetical protein